MPSSGGGSGTPIGPGSTSSFAANITSAISLPRYAYLIQYPECAFFGVRVETEMTGQCREFWTQYERDNVAKYLAEAQEEIENEIGYLLSPRWIVGTLADEPTQNDRYVDQQKYTRPIVARYPKIIEAGIMATAEIINGLAVNYAVEPAAIGAFASTAASDEIHVYHPGTDIEVIPSAINISGGMVTVYVPRCRLVKVALQNETNLDYDDLTNFEVTVDVKRIYNDPSTNAVLAWPHSCNEMCSINGCTERTQTGCIYLSNPMLGIMTVQPATYADSAWSGGSLTCCGRPSVARLYYRAGTKTLTRQAEDAILRLAHSKMPNTPCGCDVTRNMWDNDRFVPEVLTRERINSPFGSSNGAWTAYRFAQTMKSGKMSVL